MPLYAQESEILASVETFPGIKPLDVFGTISSDPSTFAIGTSSDLYPPQLRDLDSPPSVIYGVGDITLLQPVNQNGAGRLTSFIGARRASAYGREVAYSLANMLASDLGHTIVSGMALGIDGAALRGALAANGRPLGVLPCSPTGVYPRSHRLLRDQVADRGCVISATPFGWTARREDFELKGAIVAALSTSTIYVEGSHDSNSNDVAACALSLFRDLYAIPGPITSPLSIGPNTLIANGKAKAIPTTDVLDQLFAA